MSGFFESYSDRGVHTLEPIRYRIEADVNLRLPKEGERLGNLEDRASVWAKVAPSSAPAHCEPPRAAFQKGSGRG